VPTDAEWTILENYMSANHGTSGSVAKALAAKTDWASATSVGAIGNDLTKNNSSGLTILSGGFRDDVGKFYGIGNYGYWWSSSSVATGFAWDRFLYFQSNSMGRSDYFNECGFSVRCVRD
jgi:uncharacterized protein (TIGR02145 family)